MEEEHTVVFLGPGEFYAFTHLAHGYWEFVRGEPQRVPPAIHAHVMAMNPWKATLENATDYGCKLFEDVGAGSGAEGGDV